MSAKIIKVLINDDGTVEFDQIGWTGKQCSGDIKDLISALGKEKSVTKKQEYYKDNQARIQQTW
jgi:hypothetical protein